MHTITKKSKFSGNIILTTAPIKELGDKKILEISTSKNSKGVIQSFISCATLHGDGSTETHMFFDFAKYWPVKETLTRGTFANLEKINSATLADIEEIKAAAIAHYKNN